MPEGSVHEDCDLQLRPRDIGSAIGAFVVDPPSSDANLKQCLAKGYLRRRVLPLDSRHDSAALLWRASVRQTLDLRPMANAGRPERHLGCHDLDRL